MNSLKHGKTQYYCDAWASSNPGPGGYRVVDADYKTLIERGGEYRSINYYELAAIMEAVKCFMASEWSEASVWSDSQIAINWIFRDPRLSVIDRSDIMDMIKFIRANKSGITISKWHTKTRGEIPADFGRKGVSRARLTPHVVEEGRENEMPETAPGYWGWA